MKILARKSNRNFRKISAFSKILSDIDNEFIFWNSEKIPVFDAFYEKQPDIYIDSTKNVDLALIKCLKKYNQTKVILIGSFLHEDCDSDKFSSKDEIELIKRLKEDTGKPDLIIGNCSDETSFSINHWKEIGCSTLSSPSASDIYLCIKPSLNEKFISDITYIGNFTNYKAQELENIIYPYHSNFGLSVKVFGKKEWPIVNYLGFIKDSDIKDAIFSAKVCPVISKKHTQKFGFDSPQYIFDILSNKGLAVCDYSIDINNMFGDKILMAKNTEEQLNIISKYIKNDEDRNEYINIGHNHVISNHTYHHRLIDIFNKLNMNDISNKIEENLKLRKNNI